MSFLSVKDLCIVNKYTGEILVDSVNFDMKLGSVLGVIGESGSGKSLTCKAILGILSPNLSYSGSISIDAEEILGADEESLRKIRLKKISTVFQDSMNAFDPLCTIGSQMVESLQEHMNSQEAKNLSKEWLEKVGLRDSERVFKSYPHELSGGMLQRVMIALALGRKTPLIIADEPTSALDVISQKEIIKLFQTFTDSEKSLIFVSHDLGVTSHLAKNLLVMKKGKVVEQGVCKEIFDAPKHEYTNYLITKRQELSKRFLECFA